MKDLKKEIHNNHYELLEYTIRVLSISTTNDRNSTAMFYFLFLDKRDKFLVVSQNIYECSCRV